MKTSPTEFTLPASHIVDSDDPNVTSPKIEAFDETVGDLAFCQWCRDFHDPTEYPLHLRECREEQIEQLRDKLLRILVGLDDMPTRHVVELADELWSVDVGDGYGPYVPPGAPMNHDRVAAERSWAGRPERHRAIQAVLEHAEDHPDCYAPVRLVDVKPTGKVAS